MASERSGVPGGVQIRDSERVRLSRQARLLSNLSRRYRSKDSQQRSGDCLQAYKRKHGFAGASSERLPAGTEEQPTGRQRPKVPGYLLEKPGGSVMPYAPR